MSEHILWVEKYRPQRLDEYIFNDEVHKRAFTKFAADRAIPHLLLSGVQGSGKPS